MQLSKRIEENAANGRYDRNQRRRRIRKSPNFFINEESKEKRESSNNVRRKRHQRKIDKRVTEMDTRSDDDDEDDEYIMSTRLNKKRRILTLDDSSDDDCYSGDEERRRRLTIRTKKQNLSLTPVIFDDVDQIARNNGYDRYKSVEEGGLEFNLVNEMRRQDELDDDCNDIKETRLQIQNNFDTIQERKNAQLSEKLATDRYNTMNDPLFDADLSEGEKESDVSVGNVHVQGSNNNVCINIVRSEPNLQQHMGGYYPYQMMNPMSYCYRPYSDYGSFPRFLQAHPTQAIPANNRNTVESIIRSKASAYIHHLSDSDNKWISTLITVAKSAENRSLTMSQKDWVYNQRARNEYHSWKGELLSVLQHLSN